MEILGFLVLWSNDYASGMTKGRDNIHKVLYFTNLRTAISGGRKSDRPFLLEFERVKFVCCVSVSAYLLVVLLMLSR